MTPLELLANSNNVNSNACVLHPAPIKEFCPANTNMPDKVFPSVAPPTAQLFPEDRSYSRKEGKRSSFTNNHQ